ncbi:MAG: Ppx/GppA phosphatase family protein [Planctomycetota bacterium]
MSEDSIPETVAAVDLGSNSFHMVVARNNHGQLHAVDRLRVRVGLAEGLRKDRTLSRAVRSRALDCLAQFGQRLRDMPRAAVRAVGTNTLRQLRDDGEFLRKARKALGHPIEIIHGREEARLIHLGVAHSSADDCGRRLVIDIGGGSTECVIGKRFQLLEADSLFMGCVRYSQQFFPGGRLSSKRFERAVLAALLELRSLRRRYRETGWERCTGSSGTILAIATILRELLPTEAGITLPGLEHLQRLLIAAGHTSRLSLPGLAEDRAPVLPGGLAILRAAFQSFKIDRMETSTGALREGLLYDLLGRIQHEDVRDRTIHAFCKRFEVDEAQASRVERTAIALFEQVQEAWGIEPESGRRLLRWAAQLHEIGMIVAYRAYHRHGAYLALNADMPGFSREDQEDLAFLVGGHRRQIRTARLESLSRSRRREITSLCALFRIAVRLHRGRSERPLPDVRLEVEGKRLCLTFPHGWLDEHALTFASLRDEAHRLRDLDLELVVCQGPAHE